MDVAALKEFAAMLGEGVQFALVWLVWRQIQMDRTLKKIMKRLGIVEKKAKDMRTPPMGVPIVLPPMPVGHRPASEGGDS